LGQSGDDLPPHRNPGHRVAEQEIKQGDWVLMIYSSGNREREVFADPYKFDLTRKPNPTSASAAAGRTSAWERFLAKMQLEAFFRELIFRAPTLRVGQPEYLTGNFVHAVKSLPYTLD
jgi:cytochrome P450